MTEQPLKYVSVLQNIATARGLPNEHYTSTDVFAEEKKAVLFANWSGVGFAKDIPNPGDVKPVSFLGMPLLLVRNQPHTIAGVTTYKEN